MAISFLRKEKIRQRHPLYGQQPIEVCHIKDKFLGGSDEDENLVPLTRPSHLADHVEKATESEDWGVAARQYGAARLIAKRMTPEEIEEANRLLAEMPKVRNK